MAILMVRVVILAALFGAAIYGDDITVPIGDGNVLIRDAKFIQVFKSGDPMANLSITLINQTSSSWDTLKMQLDVGGFCNGEPRQWTILINTSLGWDANRQVLNRKTYEDEIGTWGISRLIAGSPNVKGCKTAELFRFSLLLAENSKTHIELPPVKVDLTTQLQELKVKQEAAAAERLAKREAEDALRAKADAAEAARQKRLAAEQKKKNAEQDARNAEERRKLRANCATIYQNTIDTKVKDLTVREEEQVRACQVLGLYPPR